MDLIAREFSGLLDSGVKPKVGVKLFRRRKQVEIPHLRDQDDRTEKADPRQGLQKADLVVDQSILQFLYCLMERFQECVQMLLVFLISVDIKTDANSIARKSPAENSGILCGSDNASYLRRA